MDDIKSDMEDGETISRKSRRQTGNDFPNAWLMIAAAAVLIAAAAVSTAVISRNAAKKAEEESIAESESIAASVAASVEAEENSFETSEFETCSIPEINMLAEEYFDARMAADSSRLFEIFGRSSTEADAELDSKLKAQADWIQSYGDMLVYTAPGLDDDSKLCLVTYTIDFRRTDTLAPGVMYFYAVRQSDGSYKFLENIEKRIRDYIDAELALPSAQELINASNEALRAALDSDSTLALIYTSFENGEVYTESQIELDREQEVGFFLPEDSILIDDEAVKSIEDESREAASIEASNAAADAAEEAAAAESAGEENAAGASGETNAAESGVEADAAAEASGEEASGADITAGTSGETGSP